MTLAAMLLEGPDPRTVFPDPHRRGYEQLEQAFAHGAWERDWLNLTGQTWAERVASDRAWRERYHPTMAHFDVALHPTRPHLTSVTVTGGVVAVKAVETESRARKDGDLRLTLRMAQASIRTVSE